MLSIGKNHFEGRSFFYKGTDLSLNLSQYAFNAIGRGFEIKDLWDGIIIVYESGKRITRPLVCDSLNPR